jgi:hypothetical protein
MNERRTDPDLSQVLTAWMDDVAPERAPARLLEETFAQTMGAEQVRVYPWHKVAIGSLGRGATRSRAPFVLLAVVALVVVGMAVGLTGGGPRGTTPSAPSPSPSVPPRPSPSVLPSPSPSVVPSDVLPAPISVSSASSQLLRPSISLLRHG